MGQVVTKTTTFYAQNNECPNIGNLRVLRVYSYNVVAGLCNLRFKPGNFQPRICGVLI